MTRVILLEQLKEFTEVVVHDLRLPVRPEEESDELPILRPPASTVCTCRNSGTPCGKLLMSSIRSL